MFDKIIQFADLNAVKKATDDIDFDFDRYTEPVQNARINILIEKIQAVIFSIPCVFLASLIFVDYRIWETLFVMIVPFIVIFILEQFKDKDAQKAYDEYTEWELEMQESKDI